MRENRIRVLFVCLGNICRSPLAEGVFRQKVENANLSDRFHIESAGTGNWHVGEPPDRRMQETASFHGVDIGHQRAQQFKTDFFDRFDVILAMDRDNLKNIERLDTSNRFRNRLHLFREFDPEADTLDVPDPYFGGKKGFESVFGIVDRTSEALLRHLANS